MNRSESWGEWVREVFERAFLWFIVWIVIAFAAGPILGDVGGSFVWGIVTPSVLLALAIHVGLLLRWRPQI